MNRERKETSRNLEGQVALVTGASRGIGRAIAVALAARGCRVALVGRDEEALAEASRACDALTPGALPLVEDLARLDRIPALVERVERERGRLDVLVNNAGVGGGGNILQADLGQWDACMQTNALAVMHLSFHAAKLIQRSEAGAIVTIASIASRVTHGGGGAYVASKHAALGFMGCVFEDLRELGVKVSTICPGFVDTGMVTATNLDRAKMIAPEDVAEAVLYVLGSSPRVCPTEIVLRPQRTPYR